eukprot:CAMPEP_0180466058 /NCGR_PEP_ID=MMETSP1036_2-20121128/26274_1 /TAXON_ID=632150 /ORGANISM="Azadinium spinosum, Strain 3D9" /LENGTH=127 /DNA_ID=CAMNT_0022472949 /DNA_START=485 /DNA_END=865 /DNA_ORIENTATION=+
MILLFCTSAIEVKDKLLRSDGLRVVAPVVWERRPPLVEARRGARDPVPATDPPAHKEPVPGRGGAPTSRMSAAGGCPDPAPCGGDGDANGNSNGVGSLRHPWYIAAGQHSRLRGGPRSDACATDGLS